MKAVKNKKTIKSNSVVTDDLIKNLEKQVEQYHILLLKAQGALEVLLQLKDKE